MKYPVILIAVLALALAGCVRLSTDDGALGVSVSPLAGLDRVQEGEAAAREAIEANSASIGELAGAVGDVAGRVEGAEAAAAAAAKVAGDAVATTEQLGARADELAELDFTDSAWFYALLGALGIGGGVVGKKGLNVWADRRAARTPNGKPETPAAA